MPVGHRRILSILESTVAAENESEQTSRSPYFTIVGAKSIALSTLARMRNPSTLEAAITAARVQSAFPERLNWQPTAVAYGNAGLALMFGYADRCCPGQGWDRCAHSQIEQAAIALERSGSACSVGLQSGLSGLAFVTWSLSRGGRRYNKLLSALDDALYERVPLLSRRLKSLNGGVRVRDYDAVNGLVGVAAYLLCRNQNPRAAEMLIDVLEALVSLLSEKNVPRCHTPVDLLLDNERASYPHGYVNCGLAHGLPGLVAILALAIKHSHKVDGIFEALAFGCCWLAEHRVETDEGVDWPYAVRLTPTREQSGEPPAHARVTRTAWCYGAPGVARALWLAGQSLDCSEYCRLALDALAATFRRPVAARRIDSPTFCHGVAGLLEISIRFMREARIPWIEHNVGLLAEQLLSKHDPNSILGFYDIEPVGSRIDHAGVLEGAAGIVLTLLTVSHPTEPDWDRLFLLS